MGVIENDIDDISLLKYVRPRDSDFRLVCYSAVALVIGLSVAKTSVYPRVLVSLSLITAGASATAAARENLRNKDAILYHQLAQQAKDDLVADVVSSEQRVKASKIRADVVQQLTEIKTEEANLLAKLSEFQ